MNAQRTAHKGKTISAPAALAGLPEELFAPVYRGCANLGIGPLEVDELEVQQVASVLGVGMDDDDSHAGSGSEPPRPGALSRGRKVR